MLYTVTLTKIEWDTSADDGKGPDGILPHTLGFTVEAEHVDEAQARAVDAASDLTGWLIGAASVEHVSLVSG